jgi:hypothetical protein
MDLTPLRNEICFTTNDIARSRTVYETIYTDYHVMIDPMYYYTLNPNVPEEKEKIELMKTINYADKKPVCFIMHTGLPSFARYGLVDVLNIRIVHMGACIAGANIDLTRNILGAQNVAQAAIIIAMYMGFSEIYLIGCEMTSMYLNELNDEEHLMLPENLHVYDSQYDKRDCKYLYKNRPSRDNEYILLDFARQFAGFKKIKKYAEQHRVKIFNATCGVSRLDMFNRIKYKTLFKS